MTLSWGLNGGFYLDFMIVPGQTLDQNFSQVVDQILD